MQLIDLVGSHPERLRVPLMGFPGTQLTQSTIRQNLFDGALQARTCGALVERFEPDAVFTMMDLSVEAEAIGLPVTFPIDESPTVTKHPVTSPTDLDAFGPVDPAVNGRMPVFAETLCRLSGLDVLKGAYVIGPFSLAGLMIGATELAMATVEDWDLVHAAAAYATQVSTAYAEMLSAAGADIVCILEPTAVLISPRAFKRFSGPYIEQVVAALHATAADPMTLLHVCGDSRHLIKAMCRTGVQGLSLDAPMDPVATIEAMPEEVVLVGNVDPVTTMVQSSTDGVAAATEALMMAMAPYPNFVLSTGCDLPPETPLENIKALMQAGRGSPSSSHAGGRARPLDGHQRA